MTLENGKVVIHAVHDRDVEGFWKMLELKEVEKCACCSKEVTPQNVGAFGGLAGKVRVVCENGHCLLIFSRLVKKKGKIG